MRDYEQDFSRRQAVAATAVSDNVVKVPRGDIGKGRPVFLQVDAEPYAGGGTIEVGVQTADDAAMSANLAVIAKYPIAAERLAKGGPVLAAVVPTGARAYMRLNYEAAGTLTGGSITAGLKLNGDTSTM